MASTLHTMFSVRIPMRTYDERVECEFIAPGVARLTEYNVVLPLAPGDVVSIDDDGIVQDLVEQAPGTLAWIFFRTPIDQAVVNQIASEWKRDADVHLDGTPTLLVRTQNPDWLRSVVGSHPLVASTMVRRSDDEPIDLPRLMREALEDS